MNTKNNRRRQTSVEKIRQVFLSLLQEKPLAQVSVAEICKGAGINRSTFYANFADIYALADHICGQLEQDVYYLLILESGWQQSPENFRKLFCHIRDNQELYRFYFKLGYDRTEMCWSEVTDLQAQLDNSTLDYHITFFRSGFNAIIKRWLQRGCPETPEQMCQVLMDEYSGRFKSTSI